MSTDQEDKKAWSEDWEKNDNRSIKDLDEMTYRRQIDFIFACFNFGIFIDVGPGVAYSEAWLLRQRLPGCQIIGLEPQLDRYLSLKMNCYPGQLYHNAVGEICGVVKGATGHRAGRSDFKSKYNQESFDSGAYQLTEVNGVSVDYLLSEIAENDTQAFIWADVEGAELSVLKGSVNSLNQQRICGFLLELETDLGSQTNPAYGRGSHWLDTIEWCWSFGFKPVGIFNIQPTHFDCIFAYESGEDPGIDFVPKEWMDEAVESLGESDSSKHMIFVRAVKYGEMWKAKVTSDGNLR